MVEWIQVAKGWSLLQPCVNTVTNRIPVEWIQLAQEKFHITALCENRDKPDTSDMDSVG